MYSLEDKGEEVGVLVEHGLGRELEVLLLKLAGDWALVAEDEVSLSGAVSKARETTGGANAPWCPGTSGPDRT